jgi:hypothetical protein
LKVAWCLVSISTLQPMKRENLVSKFGFQESPGVWFQFKPLSL